MNRINRKKRRSQSVNKFRLLPLSLKYQTKEFFNKSTLHGIRYIAETNRPFHERFMWLILTAVGSSITLMIILSLWKKFQTNPTITGLDTDFHNWDVPFPAVTVCPSNPVNKTLMEDYINRKWGNDLSNKSINYYKKFVTRVAQLSYFDFHNMSEFIADRSLEEISIADLLTQVKISCEELIHSCQWKDLDYDCCEGFLPVHSENGFCYSFNSLQAYLGTQRTSPPPKVQYIFETDSKWSLIFHLKGDGQKNIKIFVHSYEESPSMDMDPQLVWTNQIAKLFFSSKHTYTTDDVRQLSVAQRRCIFHDEKELIMHTKYSFSACMIQCRMETATRFCGCVPNFYKKIDGFTMCSVKGLACISKHLRDLDRRLPCPCELGCENTVYEVEKLVDSMQSNEPLEVGFVSWPMVRYKREVLFGWVDLLVSFGGIAGLFLGFSLLTGVEIIYYFTMRALCMVHHNSDELIKIKNEEHSSEDERPSEKLKLQTKLNSLYINQIRKDEIFTLPFLN